MSTWVPISTFILGWGSGVITALVMYRDHDRRLENMEALMAGLSTALTQVIKDVAVLYQKLRDREDHV